MNKIKVLYIGLCLLFCGCESQYDYAVEEKILLCFYNHLEELGKKQEVKMAIEELEKVYIKYGILKNKSARSYIRFIENLKNPDAQRILYNKNLIKELQLIDNLPAGIVCRNDIYADSSDLANTKLKYIISIMDTIGVSNNIISPEIIANAIVTHFVMKDFENEFYRVVAMIMLANFIIQQDRIENGILIK